MKLGETVELGRPAVKGRWPRIVKRICGDDTNIENNISQRRSRNQRRREFFDTECTEIQSERTEKCPPAAAILRGLGEPSVPSVSQRKGPQTVRKKRF